MLVGFNVGHWPSYLKSLQTGLWCIISGFHSYMWFFSHLRLSLLNDIYFEKKIFNVIAIAIVTVIGS